MLWHIELIFCMSLSSYKHSIKFECRQFASMFVGVMPLLELRILEIHSFPHFYPTCFDMLSWNFAYNLIILYFRSSASVINLCQFLLELCHFWNSKYWKYTVFRTFLLHALTYWAEISHITLFHCTTVQFRVSLIFVGFCRSYTPFWNLKYGNTQFPALFSYVLWHVELKFCIWLSFNELQLKSSVINFRQFLSDSYLFWKWKYLKYSFPHSCHSCFDILVLS